MKASINAINLIKRFEGCSATAYQDSGGLWTIGVGHLIGNGKLLPTEFVKPITQARIDELLISDMASTERAVNLRFTMPLEQYEYDALVCIGFNIGVGALGNSSIYKQIALGNKQKAAEHFMDWIYVKRKVIKGLVNRRKAEQALFLNNIG
jgi:lysozyme